jgi:polar amino acid transport system permease protein
VSAVPALTTREDRERARRRRARRSIAIASVSTVVVLGGLATILVTSPGWPTVHRFFLNGHYFNVAFSPVLSGFWLDVRMFLIVEPAALALGLAIALIRIVRIPALFPLRVLAVVYVDVMRGIPTVIWVYLVGFGVPALNLSGLPTSAVVLGEIALGMSYSAYISEVLRAGIQSIHPSQSAAGLALGLTPAQTLRTIVVPQAVRRVVPPLLNDFIALQKDVALVSIIGPQEAFRVAQIIEAQYFNFTPLMAAALLYLCVTIPMTRYTDRLLARSMREQGGVLALGPR